MAIILQVDRRHTNGEVACSVESSMSQMMLGGLEDPSKVPIGFPTLSITARMQTVCLAHFLRISICLWSYHLVLRTQVGISGCLLSTYGTLTMETQLALVIQQCSGRMAVFMDSIGVLCLQWRWGLNAS